MDPEEPLGIVRISKKKLQKLFFMQMAHFEHRGKNNCFGDGKISTLMYMCLLKLAKIKKIEVKLKRHKLLQFEILYKICKHLQNKGGGASGAYSPERRSWGCINTPCNHLTSRLKQYVDQNMIKNSELFLEKKLQKNAAPVKIGIGGALTHIAVI